MIPGLALGGRYWDRTSDPCRVKAIHTPFAALVASGSLVP
jgi:hypothetical protein